MRNHLLLLAFVTVRERIAHTVFLLATGLETINVEGRPQIAMSFTKAQISELAGVSREAGNGELLALEKEGVIRISHRRLEVLSMGELRRAFSNV
jgi:CRP-like cAMP-binding protein